jgi:hypothetical protein
VKRSRKTHSIREVLDAWLEEHRGIGYSIKTAEALAAWGRLSESYITAHSEAVSIKDGELLVKTDSPALANELSLREDEFKDFLNSDLGEAVVKKIIFRSGFVQKSKGKGPPRSRVGGVGGVVGGERKLSVETLNRVDSIVGPVKQEELKEVLRRLFLSSAKRGKKQ